MPPPEFPPEIQPAFEVLREDMMELARKLLLYRDGFLNQSNCEVLFARTATVFETFGRSLINDIIISVARLMDPPTTGNQEKKKKPAKAGKEPKKRENLTLRYLFELIQQHGNARELHARVVARYQLLEPILTPISDLRNKVLVHRDRPTALTTPLSIPITDQDIVRVCEVFQGIVNDIDHHFAESGTAFNVLLSVSNLDALLHILRRGMKGLDDDQEAEMERWRPKPGS
ncbi:MAG TPA: hypothetical protein VD866_11620 [Urbifossiella sp.]|nr:hypothetical protein [Urbifossiella sp.]